MGGACAEPQTPGEELFGAWRQVDVGTGIGQPWVFRDDLTFEKSGEFTGAGTFFVEGRRLTLEEFPDPQGADRLAFDYVATTSHWLEAAAFAVGPVSGRVGTWHGVVENLVVCADQTYTGSHQLWHLGDAIGGPLYERISF